MKKSTDIDNRIREEFKITGYEFAELRKKYGYSSRKLGEAMNISRFTVLALEKLKTKHIPYKHAIFLNDFWKLKKGLSYEI